MKFSRLTIILRHSLTGKIGYDNVRYQIVTAQLCDGGYNDIINKNGLPGLPHGCVSAVNSSPTSTVTSPGFGSFSTSIQTNLTKIGCKGRTFLGFDAPLEIKSLSWPIISATKVSKQLKECRSSQSDGCEGHFYELNFDTEPSEFSSSQKYDIGFDMTFRGSDSHVPVATFQYNCNMNWHCEGDIIPTIPVKVVHVPKQAGWVNTQAPQAGHKVIQPPQPTQPYIPPSTKPTVRPSTQPAVRTTSETTEDSVELVETTVETMIDTPVDRDLFYDPILFAKFDFFVWTQQNMNDLLGKLNSNSQRPFGLSVVEYGCSCGSFDLTEETFGIPLDETDRACKRWRQCHKCVQDEHGTCDAPYNLTGTTCGKF